MGVRCRRARTHTHKHPLYWTSICPVDALFIPSPLININVTMIRLKLHTFRLACDNFNLSSTSEYKHIHTHTHSLCYVCYTDKARITCSRLTVCSVCSVRSPSPPFFFIPLAIVSSSIPSDLSMHFFCKLSISRAVVHSQNSLAPMWAASILFPPNHAPCGIGAF